MKLFAKAVDEFFRIGGTANDEDNIDKTNALCNLLVIEQFICRYSLIPQAKGEAPKW